VKLDADLQPLDKAIVEKLTTIKKKPNPDFDSLDLDAAQNVTRTASHSKSAISLHVVLPTHKRFGLTEAQAESLKGIVVDVVEQIDLGHVAAIEVGHIDGKAELDHLHLLVSAWPHTGKSIGEMIGRLKALSSKRLRVTYPELPEKLWSASYWVSSAGGNLEKVVTYINQNADD
jgi:REP element-mobilizing transposase RayT